MQSRFRARLADLPPLYIPFASSPNSPKPMPNGFILSRALLKFQSKSDDRLEALSAVARTPDGYLWLGSDELITLERLTPMGDSVFGDHQTVHLKDFIELFDHDSEIDIEGLDYADGYLWVVESHSLRRDTPEGDKPKKDINRLAQIERGPNRSLLARLPVLNGEIVPTYAREGEDEVSTLDRHRSLFRSYIKL